MCGIVGKVDFVHSSALSECDIALMAELLRHRRPDGGGIYESAVNPRQLNGAKVLLGHRRLKVIDLRREAAQPMHNTMCVRSGRGQPLVIVFNGEIYNYRDLRLKLRSEGHQLMSQSDTEVILHLYEDHGVGCLKYLHGMFAFAIWDEQAQMLFAARDRIGKKPFFYHFNGGQFVFASEARAILLDPAVRVEPNLLAIHHYLTYGYVPGLLLGIPWCS
ncbi:MAG: hypothetical protein V3T23_11190 [Nitrososphaerales archaeon]